MQHVAGISIWMYWIVNFVWDFITYCIITSIFCLPLIMLNIDGLAPSDLFVVYCIMVIFGIFALPFVYCLSLLFSNETVGYLATAAIFVATGTHNYLIKVALFHNSEFCNNIFLMFPQFSVMRAIRNIHFVGLKRDYCQQDADYLQVKEVYLCDLEAGYECCGELYV